MKKTVSIHLGGLMFHIEEDAFHKLDAYLSRIREQFAAQEEADEIVHDVELRLAELFTEALGAFKQVVTSSIVAAAIEVLGAPEDYVDSGAEAAEQEPTTKSSVNRRLFRHPDDRLLGGVAGGLAAYFGIEALFVRLAFVVLFFTGFGVPLYVVLWLVVPKAKTTADRLAMRGVAVTLENIEQFIKEEAQQLKDRSKSWRKASNSASDRLFRFLSDLLQYGFRFAIKLLGITLLSFVFFVLLALVVGLFFEVPTVGAGKGNYTLPNAYGFLEQMAPGDGWSLFFLTGISLLILVPLFLFAYLGLRFLFRLPALPVGLRWTLGIALVLGFFLSTATGILLGLQFRKEEKLSKQLSPPDASWYSLGLAKDAIYEAFNETGSVAFWAKTSRGNAFRSLQVSVFASADSSRSLVLELRANGPNAMAADKGIESINYPLKVQGRHILLPMAYELPNHQPWQAQHVGVELYMRKGDTLFFEPEITSLFPIYHVEKTEEHRGQSIGAHSWTMTEEGLSCLDCAEME
jgi:phage shock protein PspC (stress-responsive transcriptional regulator)